MAAPDKAIIVMGVTTENIQLETAQRENAQKMTAVINSLMSLGVPKEDIQTQTYQIQPQYDFIDGKQVFRGYRVIHNLKVDIDNISMVGKIVDASTEAGVNTVNSIDFTVSNPANYYKAALDEALNDATAKAASIGAELKVNVSRTPIQIVEQTFQSGVPVQYNLVQATGTATPVQPGQIEITASIEAIFAYACR